MQPGAGFGMPGDMMGINPPQMPGRGGAGQLPPNMMGRMTGNGNPLLSLQELMSKYAGWYQKQPGGMNPPGGMGAAPPGTGAPGYSLRGPGGTNLYDAPSVPGGVGAAPPGTGAPGYSLRGPGGTNLYDAPPAQRPGADMPGARIGGPTMGFGGGPGYSLGGGVRFGENGQVYPGVGGAGGARMQPGNPAPTMGIGQPQLPGRGGAGELPPEMMGISPPKGGSIAPIGGPGFGERMTIQGGPGDMMGIMKQEDPGGGNYGPPPTNKYPPGYPGIGTIPGTGPLPPPTGTIGGGTAPTQPNPVLGPVNPNLPPAPGKSPTWPGYGGGSAWPPGWTPPATPKPGTTTPTPTPTPLPKPGQGGGGGGGWTAQPAPSNGGGGPAPSANPWGDAPNAQQLAYLQYQWEQQQWQDKLGQDAASLQWQKDQFGQNMDWQKQQWGGQFGLQQDQFGLNVLNFGEGQRQFDANYGLNQDRFGLDVLGFGEGNRRFDLNFGEGQRQFDANYGLNQDRFGLDVLGFGQQAKQQDWQNQFSQDQFGWQKSMDTARNDIAKQNAAFAAFGRRFAPNVAVM